MPPSSSPESPVDGAALDDALVRFGHDAFRPGQREAVETLLSEGRMLLVAPTGGGKSLTYQLPALLLEGTTLVISPLISLMQDQVDALEALGIQATFLASTLSPDEMGERLRGLANGRYQIAYVAPERLVQPGFRALLQGLRCPLVAIDEAHCISEWGHDFRPEYMQIGTLLKELPDARILACTATATPIVRDEILERLGLAADTPQLVRGFARPNLALRVKDVSGKKERDGWVDDALAEALGAPGSGRGAVIIYSPTRRITEEEYLRLEGLGWRAAAYHAGLEGEVRESVHRAFSSGELEVVVATNAFGMGIDRADVRGVVHLAPPGSIESYYQEVGRAGRDGQDAIGLMLVSATDLPRRRNLIDNDASAGAPSEESVRHKWHLFLELMRFAEGGSCRHDAVLRYFGDEEETLAGCGRCDVCLRLAAGGSTSLDADPEAVELIVRKALSGVARIHGRFGLGAAVALLRGAKDPRLERLDLQHTPTHGVLREHNEDWLTRLLRRCVTAGWVDFVGGDRPVAILTDAGIAVMRGERPGRLLLPPDRSAAKKRSGRSGGARPATDADTLDAAQTVLFDALRAHRLDVARAEGVPPYVVASDRTLREIAIYRPQSQDDLLTIHGIGENKAERYGEGLVAVVREHA
jgi:ATP-dependent DNA helicase RecQ